MGVDKCVLVWVYVDHVNVDTLSSQRAPGPLEPEYPGICEISDVVVEKQT